MGQKPYFTWAEHVKCRAILFADDARQIQLSS